MLALGPVLVEPPCTAAPEGHLKHWARDFVAFFLLTLYNKENSVRIVLGILLNEFISTCHIIRVFELFQFSYCFNIYLPIYEAREYHVLSFYVYYINSFKILCNPVSIA